MKKAQCQVRRNGGVDAERLCIPCPFPRGRPFSSPFFHMHESTLRHWEPASANWRICPTSLRPVSQLVTGTCARIAAAGHARLALRQRLRARSSTVI